MLGSASLLMLLARLQGPTPTFSTADNPTAKEQKFLTRFLTFAYLPVLNAWLLLCPNTLSFDWGMEAVPRITNIRDYRNWASLIFYSVLGVLVRYCAGSLWKQRCYRGYPSRKQRAARDNAAAVSADDKGRHCSCPVCHQGLLSDYHSASCRSSNNNNSVNLHATCACPKLLPVRASQRGPGRPRARGAGTTALLLALAFLALPFLPATNLLFYVGFVVAERVLYLPSAGFCLLVALGGAKLWEWKRFRSVTCLCVFVVLVAFCMRTVLRNRDWYDEESLYRSAVTVNPPKGKTYFVNLSDKIKITYLHLFFAGFYFVNNKV